MTLKTRFYLLLGLIVVGVLIGVSAGDGTPTP